MTRINFYVLQSSKLNTRLEFVCRLTEKIYSKGHRILLHTDDARQAEMIDDLLWTWKQGSFIPHEIQSDANSADSPIVINHMPDLKTDMHDVLINVAREIPLFFSQFERVTEIVDQDEETRQVARQRYRFYQDRGYPLESHEIT
ncbi:MAG TPA: DNA polymerase III subunit chi [Gammaproteobacteria bacterium]|jgi:DNA polymerase-3 subunit chi